MRSCLSRFKPGKIATVLALAAALFVPAAIGQKTADPTGVALAPAAVTVSPDAKLHELVRQVEEGTVAKAFDHDTSTSYTAFGPSTVTVTFSGAKAVTGLRVFGSAPYRLSAQAVNGGSTQAIAGLSDVDLSKLDAHWNTLALASPVTATALQLTLQPLSQGGDGVAELEVWGEGQHTNMAASPVDAGGELAAAPQALVVPAAETQGTDGAVIGGVDDDPADNSATFALPITKASVARAWLVYELNGLSHWIEAARSINGHAQQGGYVERPLADWSLVAEPVAPALLAAGSNTVTFAASGGSYRVRNVRLVVEPHDGWNAITSIDSNQADAKLVLDGLETTGWRPASTTAGAASPYLTAKFKQMTALSKLRLHIVGALTGTLTIDALTKAGWQMIADAIPASSLTQGWNTLALNSAEASALRLRFAGSDGAGMISELQAGGSPVGSPAAFPQLTVTYPDNGQYYGDMAYVRGFVEPVHNAAGNVRVIVAGKPVTAVEGAFETSVSKADLGIDAAATEWSVDVEAVYPDGARVTRKVVFNMAIDAERRDQIDASINALFTDVVPGKARRITHLGAALEVGADALTKKTRILMQPLRDVDMPALDPGMINVTGGTYRGFRFLPHGQRFQMAVKVTLPFDKSKLPSGNTEADIRTYFFNTTLGKWQPLEKAAVTAKGEIVSLTTHFTDLVNAVVEVPDSPEATSFNPTQIKDLKLADPGAKVNLIAPPKANAMGDVRLTYPVELTPGRAGMTPQLGLTYNSAGGNGWLGMGWDLPVSAVQIDTRWGVPRYDAANETETYVVDGAQLAPVAHRGPLVARTADKTFHLRVEGSFMRIIRHGDAPANYWWEVASKDGTTSFYGADPASNGPLDEATLKDGNGNIFSWALREVRDSNGNVIRYRYARVNDSGTGGGSSAAMGTELYLKTIEYTGRDGEAGAYVVTLTRVSELGEARRPDVSIDARGGFKRVTADLLRKITLSFNNTPVRSYELTYETGAFAKTLLKKVTQYDADGQLFNEHEFSYFDEARDGGNLYKGFDQARSNWDTGSDNVKGNGLLSDLNASALSGQESRSAGGHLYIGLAAKASKKLSVGAKVGYSTGSGNGLLALVDINGDGLQDKVFRQGGQIWYRANRSGPNAGASTAFGPKTLIATLPAISRDETSTTSAGPEAYAGFGFIGAFVGVNRSTTDTAMPVYFSDVNGDGLVDLVNNGSVLFNHIDTSGNPVFTADSSDTPYPIGAGAIAAGLLSAELQEVYERENSANPKIDTIRRWIAPYSGTVTVTGTVALIADTSPERAAYQTADGVRVAIQHNGIELWSARILATDYTPKTPTVGSLSVQKGDIVYFRVQSVDDGAYDQVAWAPVITYTGVPTASDANNLDPYVFDAAQDLTLIASRPSEIGMPLNGTVAITGTLNKSAATSDDAILEVLKNGSVIATQTIPAATTGAFVINETTNVLKDEFDQNGQQTQTADTLSIRLRIDSRIDLGQFAWDSAAPPTIAYTASPDLAAGAPLPTIEVPVSSDLYPESNLTAPLEPWTAPSDGTFTFEADVQGGTGSVVLTAKSGGERLAKETVTIGMAQTFSLSLTAGTPVYFEYHTTDNATGTAITQAQIRQVVDGTPQDPALSSALYYASAEDILPQRYRGWNAFGYNGNLDAASQPILITQDDLTLSRLSDVDRDAYRSDLEDAIRNGTDPTVNTDDFTLKVVPYLPDFTLRRLKGTDPELWASASGMSASRQGKNYIADPTADHFAGARAVPRMGVTSQRAVAGGAKLGIGDLGVEGSVSKAYSTAYSLLEFRDMNGDLFPDIVTRGRAVQFSPMTGGLEATPRPGAPAIDPQQTKMETLSFGVGGTYAKGRGNALANNAPRPGSTTTDNGKNGHMMPSLGVSGSISKGVNDVSYDLIDINGDGLPDRVSAGGGYGSDGSLTVEINLGYDFAPAESWGLGKINEGENQDQSVGGSIGFNDGVYGFGGGINASANESGVRYSLQDINGDGLPDRVRVASLSASVIAVAFNTGSGFTQLYDWGGANNAGLANAVQRTDGGGAYFSVYFCALIEFACVVVNPGANYTRTVGRAESTIADINGDGYPDHLTSTSDGAISVGLNAIGRTNLLKTVKRPLGASFEVSYDRAGNTYAMQQSRWVMSRLAVNDGQPGDGPDTLVSTYAYADGVYDRQERQFFGFHQCVETHLDMAAGEAPYRTITRLYKTDSFYLKGLLEQETVADASGGKYTETQNTYTVRDEATGAPLTDLSSLTAIGFPALVRTDKRWYEGQTVAGKTTFETFEYDEFGNVSRYVDSSDQGPADDVEAVIAYYQDPSAYIIKANAVTVRSNGAEMRRRTASFQAGTGNLLELSKFLADGGAATFTMTYTGDGNLATITGPANQRGQRYQRSYSYDPTVRTHVIRVADSFGYASTASYDLRWGVQVASVDVNNQQISTSYDAKGRIVSYTGPYQQGSGLKTILMDYHPEAEKPWALTQHLDIDRNPSDFIETATFIDGLGRVTQTKKDHALHTGGGATSDVMIVSGRIKYDGLGRAIEQYYPLTEPVGSVGTFNAAFDTVTPTRTTHDVLDRPLSVANPANETTHFAYSFGPDRAGAQQFRTRVTDANNIPREVFRDVDNDITSVKLINDGGTQTLWTSYQYDALDQITTVTDARNNVTRASYDNFGRRVSIDSPDSGKTDYVYDLASNLTAKITANLRAAGQQVSYGYDYNRLASISYPQRPENNVTYSYGGPGAPYGQAGRVVVMTAESGRLERQYGPLGEVVQEVRTANSDTGPDPVYTTKWRYDTWNRLQSLTYPDGEVLTFDYNSGGLIQKITGLKEGTNYTYLSFMGYDKFEARERVEYGNGTKTDYAYNPLNRRLTGLLAKTATGRTFMDMAYGYDAVGNIKTLANQADLPPASEKGGPTAFTFSYDDLYQLKAATGEFRTPPNKTDRFTLAMSYDAIHNITRKNQLAGSVGTAGVVDPDQKITYDWSYTYASGRPHAASRIGDRAFLYDLNGNQAGWDDLMSGQRRRITWDEDNRIQQIADNGATSDFRYDDDTNRVVKRGPSGETIYVNRWYVDKEGRNNKNVFAGKTRISTKLEMPPTGPGEKFVYFYHPDHLGSTSYITDQLGEVYQHVEYFPFGETWIDEFSDNTLISYLFTGKEFDEETKLYYYGARYYDPRTSVWQSPEPVLNSYLDGSPSGGVFQPKNVGVYTYSWNHPVNFVDPNGLCTDGQIAVISKTAAYCRDMTWGERNGFLSDLLGGPLALFNRKDGYAVNPLNGHVLTKREEENEGVGIITSFVPAGKATQAMSGLGRALSKASGYVTSKLGAIFRRVCSFDGSTPILTKNGLKRIDQVSVHELVFAKDLKTGATGWKLVQDRYVNQYAEIVHIRLRAVDGDPEEIRSNRIHPFFVKGKGWRRAEQLAKGDLLATAKGGKWAVVLSVRIEKKPLLAYNLDVAGFDTYFIGKAGAWVKNCDELFKRLTNIGRAEFDKLIGKWGKGTFENLEESIEYHAKKHGEGDIVKYLRSAEGFVQNLRGARRVDLGEGKMRYEKQGRFLIKDTEGKILSYGRIDD